MTAVRRLGGSPSAPGFPQAEPFQCWPAAFLLIGTTVPSPPGRQQAGAIRVMARRASSLLAEGAT